jgi:ribosomal protein S18 acetylase RimI-like enzyme
MLINRARLIQSNFVEKIILAAEQIEGVNVMHTGNLVRVDSCMPSDTFNACVVLNDEADYNLMLKQTYGYFKDKKYPMALWCWDYLKGTKAMLDSSQLILGEINIGMWADIKDLNPNPKMPSNFIVRQVETSYGVKSFGSIIAVLFGESLEGQCIKNYYDKLSEASLYLNNPIKLYIGYLNGKAVCTGSAVYTKDSAGIYDIATLPDYRNKGLGTAMFNHILIEIKKNYNGLCVLQASEEGMGIYKKAGFSTACNIYVYENRSLVD